MSLKDLLNFFRSDDKKCPTPAETSGESETLKISEDLQVTIKGLPPDLATKQRGKVIARLVKNILSRLPDRAYDPGETMYEGTAQLQLLDEVHEVKFSIEAIRVMTALAIYKNAFDKINTGAATGLYDKELAELTADHIKDAAWGEVQAFEGQRSDNEAQNELASTTNRVSEDSKPSLAEGGFR